MITSRSNDRVKWIRRLLDQRSTRYQDRAFVVEGPHWLKEAFRANHPIRLLLYSEPLDRGLEPIVAGLRSAGTEISAVSEEILAYSSDTETPSGVLAVLDMVEQPPARKPSLALVLDRLSDPGNMGTILRTAVAAGVEQLHLLPGTVDPFNPKVTRAAVGAHLHLPILWVDLDELPGTLSGMRTVLAEARAGAPYDQVDWVEPVALIVGAEAHGVHPDLRALADEITHIPMGADSESLNAAIASAVILFEIGRQRRNR